jgi:hypothetical protein
MKSKLFFKASAFIVMCLVLGCNVFSGLERYDEKNENGFRSIALTAGPQGKLNRIAFGTSSRQVNTVPLANSGDPNAEEQEDISGITPWGCVIRDTEDPGDPAFKARMFARWGDNSRRIQITAINETNNAGKIAGSEDGIAFYFWEVSKDNNFRFSADFYVNNYGFTRGRPNLNGQEAFGLMARDYVPQYTYNKGSAANPPFRSPDNPEGWPMNMEALKYVSWDGIYYAGYGRPDGPGGASNMIMVGGVKRGARVYWRTGVYDDSEDGKQSIINPDFVANSNFAKFAFLPKELNDYSMYGSGEDGIRKRPDFPSSGLSYSLSLEKTNSGFKAKIVPPSGVGKGVTKNRVIQDGAVLDYNDRELPFPDMLFSVEKEKYYVGFFAARDARVTISNIRYEESPASMCPPRVDPSPEKIVPAFTVQSPSAVAQDNYTFYARSNVEGSLALSVNGNTAKAYKGDWVTEPTNASAEPFCLFEIPDIRLSLGDNTFSMVFTPDSLQEESEYLREGSGYLMTSLAPIQSSFIVNMRNLSTPDGKIWVAPDGKSSNAGTRESPLDVATAIAIISPGQTIMLMDGIYSPCLSPEMVNGQLKIPIRVLIPRYNSGKPNPGAPVDTSQAKETNPNDPTYKYYKFMIAEHRNKAIFDFRKSWVNNGYDPKTFELQGDYWWIEGIHVRNTYDKGKGLTVFGSYNVIKWVKTYYNGDTGLQISGRNNEPKSMWPTYNRIEFCESFGNSDDARTDADGFGAKLTCWQGNVFYRCIAHHNIDDGYDFFAKKETGPIGAMTLIQCFAYENGRYLHDAMAAEFGGTKPGEPVPKAGDSTGAGGNGFKMGGEGIAVPHLAVNCLAFGNDGDGFTSNSDPAILLTHCTSVDNGWRWRTGGTEVTRSANFAIYAAGSASYEGLDAVLTQIFSWWTPDVLIPDIQVPLDDTENPPMITVPFYPPNDRAEGKSPSSGYIWRRPVTDIINERAQGRSILTLYFSGKIPDIGMNNYVDGRQMEGSNIVSQTPVFYPGGAAPFDSGINGRFLEVHQDGPMIGLPKLNGFMKLQGLSGVIPGAAGLWD